jgi:hypothetical protein
MPLVDLYWITLAEVASYNYKNYSFLKGNHKLITNKIVNTIANHLNSGKNMFKIKINRIINV